MSSNEQPHQRSRRTFLAGAGGIAAIGATAAACGGNTGRSGGGGGGGGGKSNATINQWYHQYGEAGTQQAALRYAKDYDKATVKVGWFPGDYATKLNTALLGSKGPDCFEFQFNIGLARGKEVVPLDDIIDPVKDDYLDQDLTPNTYDGKIYGVRMIDDPQFFYYRKSMFEAAGVDVPKTVDDFVAAVKKLSSKKAKGAFLGNDAGLAIAGPAVFATGHRYLTTDHKPDFTDPAVGETFGKLHELVASKSILLGAPTDWTDPSAFTQGLCAIQWCGLWAMPGIKKALGDDFGIFPFPAAGSSGKPAIYSGGWTAMVSAKAADVDATKAFVKWLWIDSKDKQEDWALSYGFHIPPRKSLAAKADKLQDGPAADAVKLAQQYGVGDDPAWTPQMNLAFQDVYTNTVRKGASPASQLATAETKVNGQLKRLFG